MNFLDKLNLRPGERRLVVLVAIVVFIVINALLVWPRFKDWGKAKNELEKAQKTLTDYRAEIAKIPELQKTKERLEGQGSSLMPEEAAIQLRRMIDAQVGQSGVIPNGINEQPIRDLPEQFFAERAVTMGFINTPDNALLDFLFNIGDRSMIRVKDLTVRPDASNQKLQGNIGLTVSYQKRTAPSASAPAAAKPPAATKPKPDSATVEKSATNSAPPKPTKTTSQAAPKENRAPAKP